MADWTNENGEINNILYGSRGTKTCWYCKENDLHWENIGTKENQIWRLCNELGEPHQCKKKK